MNAHASPTVRRRRLARELRRLREAADLTAGQAVAKLEELGGDWTTNRISRIENAQAVRISVRDVTDMLGVYGVEDPEVREAMATLCREARKRGWWAAYGDALPDAYVGFESEASKIRTFHESVIPGLLQTEAYVRAINEAHRPAMGSDEVDRHVAARLARRELLERDDPPHLWWIVHEAALRCMVGGPAVMREQLARMIEVGRRTNVELQVLPNDAGAHAGMGGSFLILEFPDPRDPPIVYIERAEVYLEREEDMEAHNDRFNVLRAQALSDRASAELIDDIRSALG